MENSLFCLSRRKAMYQMMQNGTCRGDDEGLGEPVAVSEACELRLSQVDTESRVLHVARLKQGLAPEIA